jgi:hypothetical protein
MRMEPRSCRQRKHRELTKPSCRRCRQRKVKCSGLAPCQNCINRGQPCIFDAAERRVVISERSVHLIASGSKPTFGTDQIIHIPGIYETSNVGPPPLIFRLRPRPDLTALSKTWKLN